MIPKKRYLFEFENNHVITYATRGQSWHTDSRIPNSPSPSNHSTVPASPSGGFLLEVSIKLKLDYGNSR